jgi:hypothetical protein
MKSNVMKAAWKYRKSEGLSWSEALKKAWRLDSFDFAGMAIGSCPVSQSKKLPLNLIFSYDRAVYMALYRKEAGIPA